MHWTEQEELLKNNKKPHKQWPSQFEGSDNMPGDSEQAGWENQEE